jgi:hypothetical protein
MVSIEDIREQFSSKDKIKGLILPKTITPNVAYLCGVFAGDGNISYRENKKEYSITCAGNPIDERKFYHEVIGPMFKELFRFSPKIKHFKSDNTYGFVIFSKGLTTYLTEYIGLPKGKKYSKLCIPKKLKEKEELIVCFIRGLFDTDGCITFKKRYRDYPYYPTISISSKSPSFILEVSNFLKIHGFTFYEVYNYKIKDKRFKKGFNLISRIELNGIERLQGFMENIGFKNPKHLNKISKYYEKK